MSGEYIYNKSTTYKFWSTLEQKRTLEILINPPGNRFNLKSHVKLMKFILSVPSTTSQDYIPSKISIYFKSAFQHLSERGPLMA